MQTGHSLKAPDHILKMLRIYIATKLTYQYGIESFTRQTINQIALHLYKTLTSLLIKIKRVLSVQRRTIPNLLHLLFVLQSSNFYLDNFVNYLIEKAQRKNYKPQIIQQMSEMKNIFNKITTSYEKNYEDPYNSNIQSVPQNYMESMKIQAQPLTFKMPICQYVQKPEYYTYSSQSFNVQRPYKNKKQIQRRQVHAQKQIKRSLSLLKQIKKTNIYEKKQQQVFSNTQKRVKTENKLSSFDLINYL